MSPIPSAVSFYDTTLRFYDTTLRLVTISPLRVLNRVSVWAVEVDEDQSKVTILVPPFFPQVFSMFLSLKANLSLKGYLILLNEMNQDYKVRSLGLKRVGK